MEREIERCNRCILPRNYPGVSFDEHGICDLCRNYKELQYLGPEALKTAIKSHAQDRDGINKDYDCLLGLSGGRDSTFLLHYLVKVLGLRVLAYCADNGHMPAQTVASLKTATEMLDTDLVVERHGYLETCLRHHLLAWMKRPSAALVTMICTGCRLGINKGLSCVSIAKRVPVVVTGGTPFEGGAYKTDLLRSDPSDRRRSSLLSGYARHIVRNPRWIVRPSCLAVQVADFRYHFNRRRIFEKRGALVSPFHRYLRWKEEDIVATIAQELNWQSGTQSSWRGDCSIAILKGHMYRSILGFNDKDDHLSLLVRDHQISREEALERIQAEKSAPPEVLESVLARVNIDFSDFDKALKKRGRV